jgi:hypothetical protein
MSHCVYQAFVQHMHALNEPAYLATWEVYKQRKSQAQDFNAFTYAGIVPWLYWEMLLAHNIRSERTFEMELQTSYLPPKEYYEDGTSRQRYIIKHLTQYFGYHAEPVTLAPAIYCILTPTKPNVGIARHAMFSETVPEDVRILMAIKIFEQADPLDQKQETEND